MTRYLLDVNVLLSLVWRDLEHHSKVQRWFVKTGQHAFATCPLTQAGFLRISTSPRVLPKPAAMREAFELMSQLTQLPQHMFWPLDLPVQDATLFCKDRLFGPGQLTDAYLLGLAISKDEVFVTLDRAVVQLAGQSLIKHVLLL